MCCQHNGNKEKRMAPWTPFTYLKPLGIVLVNVDVDFEDLPVLVHFRNKM